MYLTQSLRRAVQVSGREIATVNGERRQTYAELLARVRRLAGAVRNKLGLAVGGRAAILALNSDRYIEFSYAMPWAGCVFVPINTRLAPPEIAYWLADSGAEVLFVDDALLEAVAALAGKTPSLRELIYIGAGDTPEGMHAYEDLIAEAEPIEDADRGNDDLAALYYTGGTTGISKGVMLSHRNIIANALNTIPAIDFRPDMRWLHAAPMFHIADGLAIFGVTMVAGRHIFIPSFEPVAVMKAIEAEGVTESLWVPTMINLFANHPDVGNYDLSSMRYLTYGASPMPAAVVKKVVEVLPGVRFTHAYGQTECAPLVTLNGPEAHIGEGLEKELYKSCGKAALTVDIKIIDENGDTVPPGVIGEVCARGPNIMLGYWNKPEQTAAALRDGWMHSGDGAYMDEDGYLYIVDRVKDMIISGGENVYSAEVENAIYRHASVAECAVIGVPDEKWGERVHAIVRTVDGEKTDEAAIIAHCRELIAGFKCPRSVDFRTDPLPVSGAGKILKIELRKPYWEGHEKGVN
jgi:long-chain acyl-CoA synthetase